MTTKRFHQFTKADIGASVVFAGFDGGSYSGSVVNVTAQYVTVRYFPAGSNPVFAMVVRADWHRLTLFPRDSKFLALS